MDKELLQKCSGCSDCSECKNAKSDNYKGLNTDKDKELWEKCVSFHGHGCPGIATGYRAAKAAIEKIGLIPYESFHTILVVENNGCGVDAIQAITGCTFGKGNFIYRNTGKMAYSFFNRINGESIRLVLKKIPDGLPWDEVKDYILESPIEDIFEIKKPHFDIPKVESLFPDVYDVVCDGCGEVVPEHMMKIIDGKKLCFDCLHCFEERSIHWYCRFKTYKSEKIEK